MGRNRFAGVRQYALDGARQADGVRLRHGGGHSASSGSNKGPSLGEGGDPWISFPSTTKSLEQITSPIAVRDMPEVAILAAAVGNVQVPYERRSSARCLPDCSRIVRVSSREFSEWILQAVAGRNAYG